LSIPYKAYVSAPFATKGDKTDEQYLYYILLNLFTEDYLVN